MEYKLVPVEPTEEMKSVIRNQGCVYGSEEELYADLIAAAPKVEQEPVAIALHYPECWDTACYSTVWDALAAVAASFRCNNDDCAFQSTPQIPQAWQDARKMAIEAIKLTIDDLVLRSQFEDDDSLNISQFVLDKLHASLAAMRGLENDNG